MTLIDDLKTFVLAMALGVVMTLAINFVVVNYTSPVGAEASQAQHSDHDDDDDEYYMAPSGAPKSAGESYSSYY